MRKLLVIIAAFAVSSLAFAGRPTGLNIGGGFAMDFFRSNDAPVGTYYLPDDVNYYGAFVEVGYDIKVAKHSAVYFGARLLDVYQGKIPTMGGNVYDMYLTSRTFLDIPVKYQFAGKVAPHTKLFFTLGPTVNFWLGNRSVYTVTSLGSVDTRVVERINYFQEYPNMYNRVNLSLGGSFGVITHHVKIYAAYDQAICNWAKSSVYAVALGQLRVGAAYVF